MRRKIRNSKLFHDFRCRGRCPDQVRRLELYRQAEDIIIEDAVILPMLFGVDHYLVKPYVEGFAPSGGLQEWMSTVRIGG